MLPENLPAGLLEVDGLTAGYGRAQVLWGIDLDVRERESIVLLGANGAGKTTLLRALIGLIAAWSGHIRFAGEDLTVAHRSAGPARRCLYAETSGFPGLTVEENVLIGAQFLPRSRARRRAEELYTVFPILAERRRTLASNLSGGQRKMLGIAKALAGNPRLLVMDEPSAGLSPIIVREVVRVLARFRSENLALFIAEQNVRFLALADRIYTLEAGRIRFSGTVAAMHENDALQRAYFGLK